MRIYIALLISLFSSVIHAQPTTRPTPTLDPRLTPLSFDIPGPFVRAADSSIIGFKGEFLFTSRDDGASWEKQAILDPAKFSIRPEYALLRTTTNNLVCVFINDVGRKWKWDNQTNNITGDAELFVYVIRSSDNGKTWSPPVKIQDGYCGAIRDMIQTKDGTLVLPSQSFLRDGARHATVPMYSNDEGITWHTASVLDIGGRGHHDGAIEATLVERNNGSIWMIIRTPLDVLYESTSTDSGKTWASPTPTSIDASSAPAMIRRLDSGRLMLAWNRLYPEGKTEYRRTSGSGTAKPTSAHREELAIAFSDDDGATWSKPAVVAKSKRVAYPFIFEVKPGEIWLTTMQGGLRAELREADFVR